MYRSITIAAATAALAAAAGCDGARARLSLANQTAVPAANAQAVMSDGTSLRLKIISVYLAEDVDPNTMDNIGEADNVWLNPQCGGDNNRCNVSGLMQPPGPRITDYFDLARPTAEVNAELNSQGASVSPGTYRYARIDMCKIIGGEQLPTVPTLMWAGPGMAHEEPFTSADCGRSSLPFDPPLTLAAGDSVEVTLGYDLGAAVAVGRPGAFRGCSLAIWGHNDPDGGLHCFRACVDIDADTRACMDYPDFAPTATKL